MQNLMVELHHLARWLRGRRGLAPFWGMEGPENLGWLGEQEEHTALMGTTRLTSGFAVQMADEPTMA